MRLPRRAVAPAAALLMLLTACGNSAAPKPKPAPACSWSAAASAGALVLAGPTLYALDPASGRLLGHCRGADLEQGQPALEVDGRQFPRPAPQYARPVVAGADLQVLPDNDTNAAKTSTRGGVRDLSTGVRTPLPFGGWLVITAIGSRLLLERYRAGLRFGQESEAPADWCVLPSARAALTACAPVTRTTSPGSPGVAPDGTLSWIPVTARPLTIGSLSGYAASDGAVLTGYVPGLHTANVDQVPVGQDEHTVVFPAGSAVGPSDRRTLQWAMVTPVQGRLTAVQHDTGITEAEAASTEPELLFPLGGVEGAPDGLSIAVMNETSRRILVVADTGPVRVVTLQLPASVAGGTSLVRWPFGAATTPG